jgi:hypothetical protein
MQSGSARSRWPVFRFIAQRIVQSKVVDKDADSTEDVAQE